MNSRVRVRVEIDAACDAPEVVIRASARTPLVERIVEAVEGCGRDALPPVTVYRGDAMRLIPQREIISAYTELRKLWVKADTGVYEARCTMKELEAALDGERFMRISRFEIVNIKRISHFDFSVAGTIKVMFEDGSSTWAARRYVRVIQETLNGSARKGGGRP